MIIKNLGLLNYSAALKIMEDLHKEVVETANHKGYLLVVEHPSTVTMGNRDNANDLLLSPEALKQKNIDYCKIDRGGSVTVHEPGQCVIYPIFNLFDYHLSVKSYVYLLEEAMIQTCHDYGISAIRHAEHPGIWIGQNKIGAIGIRVQQKVSKHGIAFNITNSLETFSYIVPCGLRTKGVTSLKVETKNSHLQIEDVSQCLLKKILESINNCHPTT